MADVTVDGVRYLQGGVTMFDLSDVDDTETLTVKGPIKAYWATSQTNASTQGSAGVNVAQSVSGATNTFTFYPGEDNEGINFFIQR